MIAKYGITEDDIYNFDETGFAMGVISVSSKVVTSSDTNGRPKIKQPGNRDWVSVIHGVNARGWLLPAMVILAGVQHQASWYTESNLPRDWVLAVSENGWTDDEIGYTWIQHFEEYTRSRTKGQYRLLVIDGHSSHHSARFKEYCREHSIKTIYMPPYSSYILQPLDIGCFSLLKTAYIKQIKK